MSRHSSLSWACARISPQRYPIRAAREHAIVLKHISPYRQVGAVLGNNVNAHVVSPTTYKLDLLPDDWCMKKLYVYPVRSRHVPDGGFLARGNHTYRGRVVLRDAYRHGLATELFQQLQRKPSFHSEGDRQRPLCLPQALSGLRITASWRYLAVWRTFGELSCRGTHPTCLEPYHGLLQSQRRCMPQALFSWMGQATEETVLTSKVQ